ncbi:galactofuranose ABC transporter, permease protein YjfF [Pseudodesulfovibrio indicus]|uniref:galactofuranose ABC transporter, permease protein YjfF n=1 Tax=Pseudodesulfovibrio indicus TaxID=1716143 RepID=UPI00292F4CF6|nr:galactofuranose ABC transporter, permease protein YjfF [Pseudodesulfovibrio indicus]
MRLRLNQKNIPILATIAVFLIIYAIGGFMYSGFFSLRVFVNLFIDNAFIGIIAIGMTFVIISGEIDLSVGSVVALVGVLLATLVHDHGMHPMLAIPICLALGAILGCAMGCLIHFFQLPSFLVTLVGMFLARGLAFLLSLNSIPIKHPFFESLVDFGFQVTRKVWVPSIALVFVAIFALGVFLSHFTKFGRNAYAIGGNEQSAVLMGLPVGRTKIYIFTLNGLLCALAGVVYSLYTMSGYPLACVGLELDVIAAVVIGGTLLTGGVGYVEGTLIGVLILGLIQTFITFQGTLSSWWTKIVVGVLLFVFILLQRYLSTAYSGGDVGTAKQNAQDDGQTASE